MESKLLPTELIQKYKVHGDLLSWGTFYWVKSEGKRVPITNPGDAFNVPLLTKLDSGNCKLDFEIEYNFSRVKKLKELWRELKIVEIDLDRIAISDQLIEFFNNNYQGKKSSGELIELVIVLLDFMVEEKELCSLLLEKKGLLHFKETVAKLSFFPFFMLASGFNDFSLIQNLIKEILKNGASFDAEKTELYEYVEKINNGKRPIFDRLDLVVKYFLSLDLEIRQLNIKGTAYINQILSNSKIDDELSDMWISGCYQVKRRLEDEKFQRI